MFFNKKKIYGEKLFLFIFYMIDFLSQIEVLLLPGFLATLILYKVKFS